MRFKGVRKFRFEFRAAAAPPNSPMKPRPL